MESPFYDQLANTLNSTDEVPEEYLMPSNKSASLPRPNSAEFHWCTDTLFFLFYLAPRDSLQLHAAAKLFEKGWRYNMVRRCDEIVFLDEYLFADMAKIRGNSH